MKVLHLIKTGDGANWALRQIRELVAAGVDIHVALPAGSLTDQYEECGAEISITDCDFPLARPWNWPSTALAIQQLVRRVSPDIIHSHFVGTTLTMRLALGRKHPIPRLFQVPGPLHLEHALFRAAEIATAGTSDHWIGSCRLTCRIYRDYGVSPRRLFLSYYGTTLPRRPPRRTGSFRKELGIDDGVPLVGMVAYMYAPKRYLGQRRGIKGHEDFIDAIALASRRDPHIRAVVVGNAWDGASRYEQEIRDYARARCADRVTFVGRRKDVSSIYPDLDLAVHPSHSENIGGAVESLLHRVPTITTNVGGFPDVIHHGSTGWLVPSRNPESLALAIEQALENRALALETARRGHDLVSNMFDVRRTARDLPPIYERLLSRGRQGLPGT